MLSDIINGLLEAGLPSEVFGRTHALTSRLPVTRAQDHPTTATDIYPLAFQSWRKNHFVRKRALDMDPSPSLVSVQVGPVVTYPAPGPGERKWRSAIAKHPVVGPIFLDLLGLNGDAQADKKHHGGNTQAVNVYPSEHYQHWIHTPGFEKMNGGSFGENLTTLGLLETSVCIGDIFRINQAVVWVTQPRVPCYKLDRRWQRDDLREQASESGRVGWYFGVRQPGTIQAGDAIELLERPNPNWTIARVWSVYQTPGDHDAMVELSQASGLSQSWRNMLQKMLETSA